MMFKVQGYIRSVKPNGPPEVKPPETKKGLGNRVESITRFFGIKPCGGCKKRKEAWNKKFPNL